MASICSVVAAIISKKCVRCSSPVWVTGVSQLFGGIVMLAISVAMGGKLPVFTAKATLVFLYICFSSVVGYTVYYYVQKYMDNSKLFIIKFTEPLFACMFGAIILGENIFRVRYLLAFALISIGIVLGNKNVNNKRKAIN